MLGDDAARPANDVYFKVGLITIIGLSAKNAILIIEFAKDLQAQGKSAGRGRAARRPTCASGPIIMTSLAFILGVLPLVIASGAGSASQRAIGTGVIGGMITATVLAVLFVPVFFVVVRTLFKGSERQRKLYAHELETGSDGALGMEAAHGTGSAPAWPRLLPRLAARRLHRLAPAVRAPAGARVPTAFPARRRGGAGRRAAADIAWQRLLRRRRACAQLIELALANNRDLRIAVLNIEQARAQYQIAPRRPAAHRQRRRDGSRLPPAAAATSSASTPPA